MRRLALVAIVALTSPARGEPATVDAFDAGKARRLRAGRLDENGGAIRHAERTRLPRASHVRRDSEVPWSASRRCAAFAYYWACASLFVVARSGSQHSRSCSRWPCGRCIDGEDAAEETQGSERTNAPATGSRATAPLRVADQHRDHAWACGALQGLS
jgi:hypothetical protein